MKNLFKNIISASVFAVSLSAIAETTEYQTHISAKFNHPEIVVRISMKSIPSGDVKTILDGFENQIASGVEYKSGDRLQLGFMINRFRELDDGRLLLEEPDMQAMPIEFTPILNSTFKYLRQQKDVVESIDDSLYLNFPIISQAIAVHKNYQSSDSLLLERIEPENSQSGWWVHVKGDSNSENYSLTSLYQFAIDRPDLVKYLALPVGSKIFNIKGNEITIELNGVQTEFKQGSYVAELNKVILATKPR